MTEPVSTYPIILCGGSGTRLWPLSRKASPKQFSRLLGDDSLFQTTTLRVADQDFKRPLIVTGEEFRFTITEQLTAVDVIPEAVLIEPAARNTAPAVLAAALWLDKHDPEALMLVMPSDHQITDVPAFHAAVEGAKPRALDGDIITFGVLPTYAETGYGYLEAVPGAEGGSGPQALRQFVEKPDAETASQMLEAGNYLWNAGIFLFSVQAILKAFAEHAPALSAAVSSSIVRAHPDLGFTRLDLEAWLGVESISIDYAIMEKIDNLAVMPLSAGWSDLGGWASVWDEGAHDTLGNVCSSDVTAIDCSGTLLRAEGEGLHLVGIGLRDMIAVAMPDAVLVAPKSESQRVGEAVTLLRSKGIKQATMSKRDLRPWGWYETIASGDRFQVKRIMVKPGASLSLQSHTHRAEHWIVVAGTAQVTIGEEVSLITENESIYVPLGAKHRLENTGKLPVLLIEVQTGAYLGEDDIIRYADVYARS
ncbi:mannose-1-phosphate guanylyltransferase/mannose-6-phosphate isomerase [Sphingobium baderi]|uniref:mannose-1-phosphate guanylyltransferase/mannose-6-phosphate isomerase n=1 Tax=Sphingobium baderi TaxID=1332080 RepID=UPI002B4004B8|nr:mannose-1-phosphate guanylyltransferase/mannose-6-phosphate isomerase [Sphingobium baderi]WRD78806.1 mannose-1-phosphate guanylyltransferase/mannose-6-phosphate isomerase [Sphingobium baderi]